MKHKETGRTLHLVLKRKWYEMIGQGVKTEEYREIKPYWWNRLSVDDCQCPCTFLSDIDVYGNKREDCVCFHRGYTSTTMTFKIRHISVGYGNPELGAPTDREVFIIRLGERIG